MHAARGILEASRPDLLRELLILARSMTAGAFRSPGFVFYWMSARLHVAVLSLKVAGERPDLLRTLAVELADLALDTTFPHALIREAFKRAALLVTQAHPEALSGTVIDQLEMLNCPVSCLPDRESHHKFDPEDEEAKVWSNDRFHFDSMDTLRYWYPGLGRVFRKTSTQIGQRAEAWVCDRWGYFKADWWDDGRRWRMENRYQDTSNRQGDVPRYEVLQHYLEYHAMFCVAGELLDHKTPISVPPYEDAEDPWDDWLDGYLGREPERWVADVRSPTPLNLAFWTPFAPMETWLDTQPEEFDHAIGWLEQPDRKWLIVLGQHLGA